MGIEARREHARQDRENGLQLVAVEEIGRDADEQMTNNGKVDGLEKNKCSFER